MFVGELADVLVKVDNTEDLKLIAEKLRRDFGKLLMKVENTLKTKNVGLHDVKKFINRKLHSVHIEEEQGMAEYRKELHGIQDMESLFDKFLLKYYFISYLNYVLLKEISELAEDEIIASKFEEYEKSYVKLISKATFKDIVSAFHQNPDLKPSAPIGLPIIIFRLEDHWQKESLSSFVDESGLPHFESFLLRELRENCIIITYAVFPSVFSDVRKYLKTSAIQQKFQEMGVSVELPEYPGRNKG